MLNNPLFERIGVLIDHWTDAAHASHKASDKRALHIYMSKFFSAYSAYWRFLAKIPTNNKIQCLYHSNEYKTYALKSLRKAKSK